VYGNTNQTKTREAFALFLLLRNTRLPTSYGALRKPVFPNYTLYLKENFIYSYQR